MYIELKSLNRIRSSEGCYFDFSYNIVRYIEFESVVCFLLSDLKKIITLKFSQNGGVNHLFTAWEFQISDGLNEVHDIVLMERQYLKDKEVIYCCGWGFDIGYYLDPKTGTVIHTEPIR